MSVKMSECTVCNVEKSVKDDFRRGQKVCKECELDDSITYTKECNTCEKEKDITLFYNNRAKCKECCNAKTRVANKLKECIGCGEEKEGSEFRRGQNACKKCESDPNIMYEKECTVCKEYHPRDEFRLNRKKCIHCERADGRIYGKTTDKRKEWVNNNREKMSGLQHESYEKNKVEIRAKESERYHNDPQFRAIKLYRSNLRSLVKETSTNANPLLCLNHVAYREWIESRFTEEMSFDNYGLMWEIDHVLPLNVLKTKKIGVKELEGELKFIYAWYNTVPKICYENMVKNKTLPSKDVITDHLVGIEEFLEIFKKAAKIKLNTDFYVYKRCLEYLKRS
jgi:hypothetical protein